MSAMLARATRIVVIPAISPVISPVISGASAVDVRLARLRATSAEAARRGSLLLAETVATLLAARAVLLHLARALDEGLLETVADGVAGIREAIELMDRVSRQIDQAMPVLDATAPTLGLMNGTLAQLNTTLAQIDALPGVRMARRLVVRPVTSDRSGADNT